VTHGEDSVKGRLYYFLQLFFLKKALEKLTVLFEHKFCKGEQNQNFEPFYLFLFGRLVSRHLATYGVPSVNYVPVLRAPIFLNFRNFGTKRNTTKELKSNS